MFYIKGKNDETIIASDNGISKKNDKVLKVLEDECIKHFSTLSGRVKAIRKMFKYVKLTPIYINEEIILIYFTPLNNKKILFINAMAVKRVIENDNKTIVFFNSHEGLEVDAKIKQVKLSLKKAHIIEEYAKQKRYIY